jgi:hypothetical protein
MSAFRDRSQPQKYVTVFLVFIAIGWQAGCARRPSRAAEPGLPGQPATPDFVDLRPGNTVVVVIPILRSGSYVLPSLKKQAMSSNGGIEAGTDFLGYEKDFYSVKRDNNGVRVRFRRGEVWHNGKVQKVHAPRVTLFEHIENSHVRLVFLTRASEADHNMAILSSGDLPLLDEMTHEVTTWAECRSGRDGSCIWVPNGIAVRPE